MTLLAVTRPGACPTSLQKNGLGKLYRLALNAKLALYEARAEAKGVSGSPVIHPVKPSDGVFRNNRCHREPFCSWKQILPTVLILNAGEQVRPISVDQAPNQPKNRQISRHFNLRAS
jgi:hypothetical protein